MTKVIDIKDQAQVEKINALACKTPYEVWLSTDTLMLDARSLLGLFALIGKRARVVAEDVYKRQPSGAAGVSSLLPQAVSMARDIANARISAKPFFMSVPPSNPNIK